MRPRHLQQRAEEPPPARTPPDVDRAGRAALAATRHACAPSAAMTGVEPMTPATAPAGTSGVRYHAGVAAGHGRRSKPNIAQEHDDRRESVSRAEEHPADHHDHSA